MLRRLLPKKVDFYILTEVIGPFVGGVIFFTFILLSFQALRLADFFIKNAVSSEILIEMILLLALSFLPMAFPVAFLICILVGFGRLSADSELVALKASGMSLYRLTIPALSFAFAVAALSLLLSLEWVPTGENRFRSTYTKLRNTQVVGAIEEGRFTFGFFDLLIFADKVDSKTNKMEKVFIFDERDEDNPMTIVSREGEILPVSVNSELGAAILLELKNGNIHQNNFEQGSYDLIDFGGYYLFLEIDEGQAGSSSRPKYMTFTQLREAIAKAEAGSRNKRRIETELWRRIAIATTPFAFLFIGIGFGTVRTRSVKAGAILVTILVSFVYWTLHTYMITQAHSGILAPALAMMLPNLLTLVIGLITYRRSAW
jgi:lipopolysaccharide export system permease protein